MFSGIIADKGIITAITPQSQRDHDVHVTIQTSLPKERLATGASIACDGVCLTVTENPQEQGDARLFTVAVSNATFAVTKLGDWQERSIVNLEPALRLSDGLDGHLVTGHVDCIASIAEIERDSGSQKMRFAFPKSFSHLVAKKGSVTLDGISLTVNDVTEDDTNAYLECNIIAHTATHTNLGLAQKGQKINMEVDLLMRYLERLLLAKNVKIG